MPSASRSVMGKIVSSAWHGETRCVLTARLCLCVTIAVHGVICRYTARRV